MNEFALLIEEWETDIQLLKIDLHCLASPASAPQALAERRRLQRELHQARKAQVLLYGLSQTLPSVLSIAA